MSLADAQRAKLDRLCELARAVAARSPARDRLRLGRHGDPRRAHARLPRHRDHHLARAARSSPPRASPPRASPIASTIQYRDYRDLDGDVRQDRLDRDARGGRLRLPARGSSRPARACSRPAARLALQIDHDARRALRGLPPPRRLDADLHLPGLAASRRSARSAQTSARAGFAIARRDRHRPELRARRCARGARGSSPRCPASARSASTSRSSAPGCSTSRSARPRSPSARSAITSSCWCAEAAEPGPSPAVGATSCG